MRDAPWSFSAAEVIADHGTDPHDGLDSTEARRRLREFGPNALTVAARQSAIRVAARQFRSLVVALLGVAAATSFAFGDSIEGVAIVVVLLLNAAIGAGTELRAVRSMEALHEFDQVHVAVRRDGRLVRVSSEDLVPGDVVVVGGGDVVAADVRIVDASGVQVDESTLTGESVPVAKSAEPSERDTILAERTSMLFKGTAVTRGYATGVVVATGPSTELGRISELISRPGHDATPLEQRLAGLGRRLIWVTLAVAAVVALSSLVTERDALETVQTAIALAVAAVPEGLPIVATLALARGMLRMARRNALVERLSAVETLGSTSVILTDKTGTLTENKMTVERVVPAWEGGEERLLMLGALCNEAIGDPMEEGLLRAAGTAEIDRERLLQEMPQVREVPFDATVKMMATYHRHGDSLLVAVKGAPEPVIAACTERASGEQRPFSASEWLARAETFAQDGLRVLALAEKSVDSSRADPFVDLSLVGLVALWDPPRDDVADAISTCDRAGINVVMVTGDHEGTARSIGKAVGVANIHARVTPEEKLDLLAGYQRAGAVVAMIGDGVNDAPALKRADIGVAMGLRGTQVAREASAMVLLDDRFDTIVHAIGQGRAIFDNIRTFVVYLLSCNLSEIMVVGLASMIDAPLPVLPLQILFLNLVTDVFPALALATIGSASDVLDRRPRPRAEPLLTRRHWRAVGVYGTVITTSVLGGLALARTWLGLPTGQAVTVSFLILAFAQLVHVFDMGRHGRFVHEVSRNGVVWAAVLLCTGLLVAAVFVTPIAEVLGLVAPTSAGWLLVATMSIGPLAALRSLTVRP